MANNKYNYMAFIVDVKKGTVEEVYGAEKQGPDYTLGDKATGNHSGLVASVTIGQTNDTPIETFYAKASPGCRYVKVGEGWKQICN